MSSVSGPRSDWAKYLFLPVFYMLPGTALAHGFGDFRVFTFFSVLLLVLVVLHCAASTLWLRKEKFGSKRLLRLSAVLSTASILIWLFVFKIVMDSHSADVELFVLLALTFVAILVFAILPVRQYERLAYGSDKRTRRVAT